MSAANVPSLKRPSSNDSCCSEIENEPANKKSKTRQGSEASNVSMDMTNKNDNHPLGEWNRPNRTKEDANTANSPQSLELLKATTVLNQKLGNTAMGQVDNIESMNGNSGSLSPASMKFVSQLPNGCENAKVTKEESAADSDDELEDDDNYLDSEPDDNVDKYLSSNNEDEDTCCEDDQSVISTLTVGSTSSLRSIASETVGLVYMNENGIAANEDGSLLYAENAALTPVPALTPSLFPNVPVTINFCRYDEKTEPLPRELVKLLKWRFSPITPLIVKKTLVNSGFKVFKKSIHWIGTWGKNPKSASYKGIKDFQKMNHFPGAFQIGRKDKLWKNFVKLQSKFGKEEFGFMPKTFVLPHDLASLKAAFEKEGVKKKWIVKPPASARGTGIEVVNKWSQLPQNTPVVVQRYISRPYLINNTKFDIRLYVLVTSFNPLRIFLYEDGLVRFASVEYQKASKTLGDRFMHLTNYSVNKSSSSYTPNDEAGQCQGHKWTLKTLWAYLKTHDIDTGALWSKIADLVIKTIISGESEIVPRIRKGVRSRYSCFEIFGFDVILDEKLRPWLLEVNISPSLHSASSLDHSVKGPLVSNLLNLVGFHLPDKIDKDQQDECASTLNLKSGKLFLDRRLYTKLLSPSELAKHAHMNSLPRSQYLSAILENLEPDDVRQLITVEDQLNRAGKFTCIFPTSDTYQYFPFLDKPKYYNKLLDAWENAYGSCRDKGIQLLTDMCLDGCHLRVPPKFKLPSKVSSANRLIMGNSNGSDVSGCDSCNSKLFKKTTLTVNPLKASSLPSSAGVSLITKARLSDNSLKGTESKSSDTPP